MVVNGFCKFDCKTYQRGCAGSSDGYTKDCEKYDPEPEHYLITPMDLDDIYRGDSDSSSSAYEETRKHPYQCGDDCKGECSGEVDGVVHCPHQLLYTPGDIIELVKDYQRKIDAARDEALDEFLHLLDVRCDYIHDIKISSNEIYKMAEGLKGTKTGG